MFSTSTPARNNVVRIGLGFGAAVAATLVLPGVAQAHVSVQPGTAEGGGFSVVAFRVPNERDDASTTRVRVLLPRETPIGFVQTTAMPGWNVATKTRKLATPLNVEGEKLDTVVSQVTWTATNGGVRPGQYEDFDLSLGQLPDKGKMVFNAQQTYSDGAKVNWNEVSADPSVEPEHPAPTLTIKPAAATSEQSSTSAAGNAAGGDNQTEATAATTDSGSNSALPLVLSGAALVVSLLTALLVWRRGRPVAAAEAPAQRTAENAKV